MSPAITHNPPKEGHLSIHGEEGVVDNGKQKKLRRECHITGGKRASKSRGEAKRARGSVVSREKVGLRSPGRGDKINHAIVWEGSGTSKR